MATIALGEYLWRRIKEIGIDTVMGLPGDFNLQLLDHIYSVEGLRWVGTGNELNAAYAADGYARIKNVPGCLVTTHGVGELSALNGIAGSLTEQVKVIHIAGQTPRALQENHIMIHHSIGFNPDHQIFTSASERFRHAAAKLWDPAEAPAEIDRVIRECFLKSGPVYIFFPLDLTDEQVPADRLNTPIDILPHMDGEIESVMKSAAETVSKAIAAAKKPVVFADALVMRHSAVHELRALVDLLKFPTFTSGIGMGMIEPTNEYYLGTYNGSISNPGVGNFFEQSDLILVFGRLPADTNSGGFSQYMPKETVIDFTPEGVEFLGEESFSNLSYHHFLPYLASHLSNVTIPKIPISTLPKYTVKPDDSPKDSDAITTTWFWPRFSAFLQPGDSVFADTGTSLFGIQDSTIPRSFTYNTQTYYGSIGYATPAAMGADFARQELSSSPTTAAAERAQSHPGRTVLLTGDGSIQLTVQELGTMVAHRAPVVIVVINNAGYTVERAIHGARQAYNDIPSYDYAHALRFFGMDAAAAEQSYVRCATRADFEAVLQREDLRRPENVKIVEVVTGAFDSPWRMLKVIGRRGAAVVREMEDGGFTMREAVADE